MYTFMYNSIMFENPLKFPKIIIPHPTQIHNIILTTKSDV